VKIVIVTQRIDYRDEIQETRDAIDHRLIQWLAASGYIPVVVSNILIKSEASNAGSTNTVLEEWLRTIQPNALLLSGGNDIGEYPIRDKMEKYLLTWAKNYRIPVLGICRGLQMMAVYAGALLIKIDGHVKTRHHLNSCENTYDWPVSVNSYHNWALSEHFDGFRVLARSEDGSIEAIRHIELPWEGWMWHPERETPFTPQDLQRLKKLFGD